MNVIETLLIKSTNSPIKERCHYQLCLKSAVCLKSRLTAQKADWQ